MLMGNSVVQQKLHLNLAGILRSIESILRAFGGRYCHRNITEYLNDTDVLLFACTFSQVHDVISCNAFYTEMVEN